MHHPTARIANTTAFVTPVVEHWLDREIVQWVHPMKNRSDEIKQISTLIVINRFSPACTHPVIILQLCIAQESIDKNVLSVSLNKKNCTLIVINRFSPACTHPVPVLPQCGRGSTLSGWSLLDLPHATTTSEHTEMKIFNIYGRQVPCYVPSLKCISLRDG